MRFARDRGGGLPLLTMVALALASTSTQAQEPSSASPSPLAQQLIAQLDSQDAYERQKAFVQLEALREPATAPMVRGYLKSREPQTRAFSVRALAAIEGLQSVPTVLDILQRDRNPQVRVAAVLALEPLRDPASTPVVIKALRDRKAEVRMAAVDVLSRLEDPHARAAILLRWKRERHRDVRRVLEDALKRMGITPP